VEGCSAEWSLSLGDPFPDAYVSLAAPATKPDGGSAVLKIQFPGRETEHEAEALRSWDGNGAVRLLGHDPHRHALLLERCEPGTSLTAAGPDLGLDVLAGLLPRLWVPAGPPIRTLAEEAAWWASDLEETWERAGRPFERSLISAALNAMAGLAASQGEQVLLHQDLHAGNVLAARREPWLVIDPKPLAGEREFGIAPIVRGAEFGHGRELVLGRLDRLCATLDLDRERAREWALAQTVAWAFEGNQAVPGHVDVARWLRD
jgi:streptomycin 6-kinase